jgi:cytochrome c-type biogenesis protein CcmH
MRVRFAGVAILSASLAFASSGVAQVVVSAPDVRLTPAQETRARAINKELRCVVCQNQSIDESNAPLAIDLRNLVRERLAAGETDRQAMQFIVQRYGNFVLLRPPFQFNTLLLWLGPFLLFGVAAMVFVRRMQLAAAGSAPEAVLAPEAVSETGQLSADDEKRLSRLLTAPDARKN